MTRIKEFFNNPKGVFALYQWYTKKEEVNAANRRTEAAEITSTLLTTKNNRLSKENTSLRKKLK